MPPKVLIIRTGAMGDVIHGMHAVAGLRAAMPECEIGWAIEPHWEPLLRSADGKNLLVDRVHHAETKAWGRAPFSACTVRSVLALRRALRTENYDIAIDLQGSIRSAVIARMSGAERLVGAAYPREAPAKFLYTERVRTSEPHVIAQAAQILSAAMQHPIRPALTLRFPVDDESRSWCNTLLELDARPVAMLAPRAGWGAKQWPAERFGALAYRLRDQGMRVLVNAIPGGDAIAAAVVTASDGAAEPIECTLPQLIALTPQLKLFVGGDTGPLHLAAACGVPVVALFGPTDPTRTSPWGTTNRVLRDAASVTDHRRHVETEAGLARIQVEDVVHAATELARKGLSE